MWKGEARCLIRRKCISCMYKDGDRNNAFIKRHRILSSGHDMAIANTILQQLQKPVLCLYKTGSVNSQLWIEEMLIGRCPCLLNFWQLMDSGERDNHGLSCVPNGVPIMFQWLWPNLWPHSQFKLRGPQNNTTKPKGVWKRDMWGGERADRYRGRSERIGGDSRENQDIHVSLSVNKFNQPKSGKWWKKSR